MPYMQPIPYPYMPPPPNGKRCRESIYEILIFSPQLCTLVHPWVKCRVSDSIARVDRVNLSILLAPAAYMQPPPGTYPPPNGAGPRPSMPPTPIPSHAHPYYHQSPQREYPAFNAMEFFSLMQHTVQHAVPYPMMMPPPGAPGVPHPYEGTPAQPVQMGGHA